MTFMRLEFHLVAKRSGVLGFTGHKIRGLFLGLLGKRLSNKFHGSLRNQPAVYGILPLRSKSEFLNWRNVFELKINEGGEYFFSVSLPLSVGREVIDVVLDKPGVKVKIGDLTFVLKEIVANVLTIQKLDINDVFTIDFITPTFFKSIERLNNVLLPLPELVVSSAARLWNSFVGEKDEFDSESLKKQAMKTIRITKHRIWTAPPIHLSKKRKLIGFLGTVTYQVVDSGIQDILSRLLAIAQIMNIGNSRTMGFGVIKIRNRDN